MTDLPDVNVWLALVDDNHAHHDAAVAYWRDESYPEIAFCRVTSLAFLRLSTHPKVLSRPLANRKESRRFYSDPISGRTTFSKSVSWTIRMPRQGSSTSRSASPVTMARAARQPIRHRWSWRISVEAGARARCGRINRPCSPTAVRR
jgi:hypothetical protein